MTRPLKLLLLESDQATGELFLEYLTSMGGDVDYAKNSDEALSLLRNKSYDVLLATHRLNGMAPREFFHEVYCMQPDLELVLVSQQLNVMPADYVRQFKRVYNMGSPVKLVDLWSLVSKCSA